MFFEMQTSFDQRECESRNKDCNVSGHCSGFGGFGLGVNVSASLTAFQKHSTRVSRHWVSEN